jgi:hypothetical protein
MYNLMAISKRLSLETRDDGIIAKLLIDRARAEGKKVIVIAGMRQLAQFKHIIAADPRAICLYLHTHNRIRYQRYLKRYAHQPGVTPESYEGFLENELKRNTWTAAEWQDQIVSGKEQQNARLEGFSFAELCQYHWLSDGSIQKLDLDRNTPYSPTSLRERLSPIIHSDPDELRVFLRGREIANRVNEIATPDLHREHIRRTQLNSHIAHRSRTKTHSTLVDILSDGGIVLPKNMNATMRK